MNRNEDYSVSQAVLDALDSLKWNETFHCNEFFDMCRENLRRHGSHAKPYDGTLQRLMRKFRHTYNVKCVGHAESLYMKCKVVENGH